MRYSLSVLRLCDRWKQLPSTVEDESQSLWEKIAHEEMVRQALKRHM